ncbi:LPXTG cell wall anchor domain-containing protein [Isobaculum melis]|uniref:LPXTG-motif cell wall anchor domain-containing protein n=1 Tax=Isobaculum melis TaxID=142588 RepID=A0A1H9TQL5_9LACT|nr:LPXTG cell wall anchor domain-containing protein [Isobaculum melis]SER99446.1 LPXTG-motif cell wall anchor domain-containing protein [Isobaculum melis]
MNEPKKKKAFKKHLNKGFIVLAASVLFLSPFTPIIQNGQILFQQSKVSAAGLADVNILSNTSLTSKPSVDMVPNENGNYDVDLTFTGEALASVGLADSKVVVFSLPPELKGKVVGNATVDINVKFLPFTPADLPAVKLLLGTLNTALNALKTVAAVAGVNLTPIVDAITQLQSLQTFGDYNTTVTGTVSPDGSSISVDYTSGLGSYVKTTYAALFNTVQAAITTVRNTVPGGLIGAPVRAALDTLQLALNPILTVVTAIVGGTSNVLDDFFSASLLGQNTYRARFEVQPPGTAQATIHAATVNTPLINANLLSLINSEGANVTLNFATDWNSYLVASPTIQPVDTNATGLSGNVVLNTPIPNGSTFEAVVTFPDNTTLTAPVNPDGSFTVPFTGYLPQNGETLSTIIRGTNMGIVKDSTAVPITVTQGVDPAWAAYTIAPPVVAPIDTNATTVNGKVTLNTPVPPNSTFEAIVTLPDGSKVNTMVNPDGSFSAPLGGVTLQAGDVLSTIIQGTNAGVTKDSTPVSTTVSQGVDPAWAAYIIADPAVEPVDTNATAAIGKVTLNTPIPPNSTFEAIVTLPDGSKVNATVNPDGTFAVPLGGITLQAGDILSTIIQGTNAGVTKDSNPISTTVRLGVDPAWADYQITAPNVNPIDSNDFDITGKVVLTTPIPPNSTFKAIATLPDGAKLNAVVAGDGTFTIPLNGHTLNVGDTVSTLIEGSNAGDLKNGPSVVTIVDNIVDPLWTSYLVAAPTVQPVREGQTTLTGKMIPTLPIPVGTTFEAIVTLPDQTTVTGPVDASGNILVPFGSYTPTAGEMLSTIIRATHNGETKDSTAVTVMVAPSWENYTVGTPTVNPIDTNATEVTGHVTLTQPIPVDATFEAIVTLPDGSKISATVNPDGTFAVPLDGVTLQSGDVLSTIIRGTNADGTKDSAPVSTTVTLGVDPAWEAYVIADPVVEPVDTNATSVNGKVTLNTPIPPNSTFEAIVTLPDGSKVNATVNPDGTFAVPLAGVILQTGDVLSTIIQGTNAGVTKDSQPVSTTVSQGVDPAWAAYVIADPVVEPIDTNATTVSGKVTLNAPIPPNSTFEAIVTLPDGSKVNATVNPDGTFAIPLAGVTLQANDVLSTIIQGTNAGVTKDSNPISTTVSQGVDPAWEVYQIAPPTVEPIVADDTTIKGKVNLMTPVPPNSLFKAIVTLPDSTQLEAAVAEDGTFTISTAGHTLTAGGSVTTFIQGENAGHVKNGPTIVTIVDNTIDPIWQNYVVATPTVNPVTVDDTAVTGHVTLTTPIPANTMFEAVVTLPDGSKVTATVNPDGTFSVPLGNGTLNAGETISVVILATHNDETKESIPVTITIEPSWAAYDITTPTIQPLHVGDTELKGSVTLTTPIPTGSTFKAVVTLPDLTTKQATVNEDGQFIVDLTGITLTKDSIVKTQISGTNAGVEKTSATVDTIVLAGDDTDNWLNYALALPTVHPIYADDTEVTGNMRMATPPPAGTTLEAIVTLPDASTASAALNADGTFSVPLNGKTLTAGDTVTTVIKGTNEGRTKMSLPVSSTILPALGMDWSKYLIAPPVLPTIHEGDQTITGTVLLEAPIPEASTFTVNVTLADGTVIKAPVTVPNTVATFSLFAAPVVGSYTTDLSNNRIKTGDVVTAFTQGTNNQIERNSTTVQTTVLAKTTTGGNGNGNGNGTGNTGNGTIGTGTSTQNTITKTTTRSTTKTLPNTGEKGSIAWTIAGSAFVTIAIGLWFVKKRILGEDK